MTKLNAKITPTYMFTSPGMDQVEQTVIGAYPHVVGEWDGESWLVEQGANSSDKAFLEEIAYIRQVAAEMKVDLEIIIGESLQ